MRGRALQRSRGRTLLGLGMVAGLVLSGAVSAATRSYADTQADTQAQAVAYDETYRPQFHYTPAQHWMNDPNGLVYYKGEYHLFYQHNPNGNTWGDMSWGHAVSKDLVRWQELPLAIPRTADELIFSGSVVVDRNNSSGFGTRADPPLVAIYTSAYTATGIQAQSLAYSIDSGRTWTKYAGNPVLDIGSREFRDPKVFWYAPQRKWVMALALAQDRKIALYSSTDLKAWTHMSDFGPANAVGGVWEVPDLFQLPVDGNSANKKWVLLVNLNPGAIGGGSGAQYFVGDFDGTTFTADNVRTYTPPAGDVFADFEGPTYGPGWSTTGTAFGSGPAQGSLPGQQAVAGFVGTGLVNSFIDFDNAQGTLTSPPFTITRDYINFLVGGGAHAWRPDAGDGAPPPGTVFADFEGTDFAGWTPTGNAFGPAPTPGNAPCQGGVNGFVGAGIANSFHNADPLLCDSNEDDGLGSLTSPSFTIGAGGTTFINFLIGGGPHAETAVRLFVDGNPDPVRVTSGPESETMNWAGWDVSDLAGQTGHIEVFDGRTGGWGHVMADQFVFSTHLAKPRSTETSVNLVVDQQVVRNANGEEGEALDWTSWNVSDLIGRQATIQIVDRNGGGWGHINADQITFADEAATSTKERASWVDFGRDNYAVVTFNNVPGDRRIGIGWMNNWQYANQIPTDPWRSAMTVVREFGLKSYGGVPRLINQPVTELQDLRSGSAYRGRSGRLAEGVTSLTSSRAQGDTLEIEAVFKAKDADQFGLHVRVGPGEETVIGYDATTKEVYIDRAGSGDSAFSRAFASDERAPVTFRDGTVRLRVLVDRSSVEVFADDGRTDVLVSLTDQIFPAPTSQGVALFSTGGRADLRSLKIWQLESAVD